MSKAKLLISIALVIGAILLSVIAYFVGLLTSLTEFTTLLISTIAAAMILGGITFAYKTLQKPDQGKQQEGSVGPGVLLEDTEDTLVEGVTVPKGEVGVQDKGGKRDQIKNVNVRKEPERRVSDETEENR